MKILKVPWLGHIDEHRKYEVYTVDISKDNEHVATGGLDGLVKIWSLSSIINVQHQEKQTPINKQKPLASMSRHTGAVTVVKFSPDGKYLATGSDDRIILIWEKESTISPSVSTVEATINVNSAFGSDRSDEHWVVRKRLAAHENDIQDLCWSPDSSLLVSVGLDRSILVWNGITFEKIKKFDVHNSHVKGVIFDPANKYFATASDDRTVKIFRYHKNDGDLSFSIESVVTEPFKGSPLTTYFRRLSWSPDGQHIAVPNATNGPVSSVAIIDRGSWDSDISLIGHVEPTEVARFNPRLYKKEKKSTVGNKEIDTTKGNKNDQGTAEKEEEVDSIVCTAGRDKSLVLWTTNRERPIFISYDIALKSITDMCWNPTGNILLVASLDGSITPVIFHENELGTPIPLEENIKYLHRYGAGKESNLCAESVDQLKLEELASKEQKRLTKSFAARKKKTEPININKDIQRTTEEPKINILIPKRKKDSMKNIPAAVPTVKITKSGKKRVTPILISTTTNTSVSAFKSSKSDSTREGNKNNVIKTKKKANLLFGSQLSRSSYPVPRLGVQTLIMGIKDRLFDSSVNNIETKENVNGLTSNRHSSNWKIPSSENTKNDIAYSSPLQKPRQLVLKKAKIDNISGSGAINIQYSSYHRILPDDDIVIVQYGENIEALHILEIKNGVERSIQFDKEALLENPTKLCGYHEGKLTMTAYLPEVVNCAIGSTKCQCWIIATTEGSIYIFSENGKLKMPKLSIGYKIIKLEIHNECYLVALSENGLFFCWDLLNCRSIFQKISIAPLLVDEGSLQSGGKVRVDRKLVKFHLDIKAMELEVIIKRNDNEEEFKNKKKKKDFDYNIEIHNDKMLCSYVWNNAMGCWFRSKNTKAADAGERTESS
ncbi:related to Protein HIR1 [Saccharomycodes ludwigii]|uniref:Protein HIR n=1 Tax=Saccharomycodes ludwigii TaxID=36035 RepID=A0A376B4D0_9ASCO|nr:related to Protein HIR1 [Saccharomycodes ludwigii]